MHAGLTMPPTVTPHPTKRDRLQRFLQAYWLRPENALWMALRSQTLAHCPLEHPSADLCCGDGVFGFLHNGGVFCPSFDVFTDVRTVDPGSAKRQDMFDCMTDAYQPTIRSSPDDTIDVGTDIKATLLAKAKRLALYNQLIEHDHNKPLPFPSDSFQTVYCNAAYWVRDIAAFLRELRRITRTGGRIILQVKLESLRRYTLQRHQKVLGRRFLDILASDRLQSWPTLASRTTWENRFATAGLTVRDATPFITRTHAHIWDIGLRPIAPMLIKMANALAPQTRAAIKQEWVELLLELIEPLCDPNLDLFSSQDEPAEVQYVLTPD